MSIKLNIEVINLDPKRWKEYRDLRLNALRSDPHAFGKTYDEESKYPDSHWRDELTKANQKNTTREISFVQKDGLVVGMMITVFNSTARFSHIARFSGVYVDSTYRGLGIGKIFLQKMIKRVFGKDNIKKIKLNVNKSQQAAINLYTSCGFTVVGTLKKEFRVGDTYEDGYQMELVR